MAEPTLQDVFGAGATQTATTITLLKADLDMTASASNRGEQVLAAIVKKAATTLTAENFATDIDRSINVTTGYDSIVYRTIGSTTETRLQNQLILNFTKVQTSAGITPDDY